MKRSRPRRESAKHRAERDERAAVVAFVLARDGYKCQATALAHDCHGPLDCHERVPRSAWRAGYLVVDNCVTVCRAGHAAIHDRPADAHALGLLAFSWERP